MAFAMVMGEVRKMVPLSGPANTIVSPGPLDVTTLRNEPGGPSSNVVTVHTAAWRGRALWRAQQAKAKVLKVMALSLFCRSVDFMTS